MKPNSEEQAVFAEALLRDTPAARATYLIEACGTDAALRQRVEALLRASENAGDFLEEPPTGLSSEAGSTVLVGALNEKPGDRIGRYKLLQQIGEGGCGVVYMAEQEEPVRRRVALKVIKLGMDTKSVIARFEAERQALALMDHPNIAKVLDAGATETGRPYFVMELVRGIKITEYCDENNLSTAERLELFTQVCQAIQHAHQKGIIHRDIKPSNILVTQNEKEPVPKVIDFGIAKATTDQRLTDETVFTAFEQFIGTPAYMSPEQAMMTCLDIDTRTDIYALGVLLYELLTGRTPFDAEELLRSGLDAMRRTIREQEPARPSTRLTQELVAADVRRLKFSGQQAREEEVRASSRRLLRLKETIPLLRGDLDWIVMKALEKDRTRRYETANGLAADIERHMGNEPVTARPQSAAYRFHKLIRRNKLAFAAASAVTLALVLGLGISTWMFFNEQKARQRAAQAEKLATERLAEVSAERDAKEVARQEAEAVSKFMTEVFQSPNPARDGRTVTVAETLDKAAKKLETELAGQPARRARLQATLGYTYQSLGLPHAAIPLLEKALQHHQLGSGPEHPETLTAKQKLADAYHTAGRSEEARQMHVEVLKFRRQVLGPEHRDTLWSMHRVADFLQEAKRWEEARQMFEEVLALSRKALGPEDPGTAWAMHQLAYVNFNSGRRDEALELHEKVLVLFRKLYGAEHPDTLSAMHGLAASYGAAGREAEALKMRETVLALQRKVLGPEHPDTFWTMNGLATSYATAGRGEEALQLQEESLRLRRKVFGTAHPDTHWSISKLAKIYSDAGRHEEAIKLREELLALRRKANGQEHPDVLRTMTDLARSYRAKGDMAKAEALEAEVASAKAKTK